jgi:hypothetical protein
MFAKSPLISGGEVARLQWLCWALVGLMFDGNVIGQVATIETGGLAFGEWTRCWKF